MRQWLLPVDSYPFLCLPCQSRQRYTLGQRPMHAQSEQVPVDDVGVASKQVPRLPTPPDFPVRSRWLADKRRRLSCNSPGYTTPFLCHSTHKSSVVPCLMLLHMHVRLENTVAVSTTDHRIGIFHARYRLCLLVLLVGALRILLASIQP